MGGQTEVDGMAAANGADGADHGISKPIISSREYLVPGDQQRYGRTEREHRWLPHQTLWFAIGISLSLWAAIIGFIYWMLF
jgi:hypothetical protein